MLNAGSEGAFQFSYFTLQRQLLLLHCRHLGSECSQVIRYRLKNGANAKYIR